MEKQNLINEIEALKPEAISLGFDYPSEDPSGVDFETLVEFKFEIEQFISQEG
jgi:hypothetical protein